MQNWIKYAKFEESQGELQRFVIPPIDYLGSLLFLICVFLMIVCQIYIALKMII